MSFFITLLLHVLFFMQWCSGHHVLPPPPLPLPPIPTAAQLKWQRREIIMFFHFGMNTFTDAEWGTGEESPSLFNPPALDASQWIDVAVNAGVSLVILVAKHHDGFCLWPSAYTNHTVERSPWRGGRGDLLREFTRAAAARGVDVGLYLSPWDRHEWSYGLELEYNEYYMAQLEEILGRYGPISEIWFDGAKGKNATDMTYYFQDWFRVTKGLQPSINIFSDAGPDIRWVGDEQGRAGRTCWSTINRTLLRIGATNISNYQNSGDSRGSDWIPPECDVSIRKGWFWHKNETPKPLRQLLDIYYRSVGRNCVLLLNVPPNSTGLVQERDVERLRGFREAIDRIFNKDLTQRTKCAAVASSQRGGRISGRLFGPDNVLKEDDSAYWAPEEGSHEHWVELRWKGGPVAFNVVRIEEPIWMGQRIEGHEVWADGRVVVEKGTTVGHKRLHRLKRTVKARKLRVRITRWRCDNRSCAPLLSAVGVHFDPFWDGKWQHYQVQSHPSF